MRIALESCLTQCQDFFFYFVLTQTGSEPLLLFSCDIGKNAVSKSLARDGFK